MYESYAIIRDRRGWKDAEVARATEISKSVFSEWKSGRSTPKIDKLYRIARVLRCNVEDFYIDFTPEAAKKFDATAASEEEVELLNGFRAASRERREDMLDMARKAIREKERSSSSEREGIA